MPSPKSASGGVQGLTCGISTESGGESSEGVVLAVLFARKVVPGWRLFGVIVAVLGCTSGLNLCNTLLKGRCMMATADGRPAVELGLNG